MVPYSKFQEDPEHPGLCFCQSFLYHDTPAEMKRKQGYLMDESEIQLGDAVPKVDEKAEVELTFTRVSESGAEYAENKWWLCMVVYVGEGCIGVVPPGYSMDEFASQEGFETVQDDAGVTSFRLSPDSPRLNRSGKRKTAIQVGQAPFGCVWYGKWVEQVEVAESKGQRAIVVYKKGLKGKRWPGDSGGLGFSQMKEVAFLQSHYQKYDENHRAFDKTAGFKEISAREFEEANALNRAQIYGSATSALVHESGKTWGGGGADAEAAVEQFLRALAYASHTRDDAQFRSFTDAFAQREAPALLPPHWPRPSTSRPSRCGWHGGR